MKIIVGNNECMTSYEMRRQIGAAIQYLETNY